MAMRKPGARPFTPSAFRAAPQSATGHPPGPASVAGKTRKTPAPRLQLSGLKDPPETPMSPAPDRTGTPQDLDPPTPRRRGLGWTLPALVLLAAGGWGAWWYTRGQEPPPRPVQVADAGEPDAGA